MPLPKFPIYTVFTAVIYCMVLNFRTLSGSTVPDTKPLQYELLHRRQIILEVTPASALSTTLIQPSRTTPGSSTFFSTTATANGQDPLGILSIVSDALPFSNVPVTTTDTAHSPIDVLSVPSNALPSSAISKTDTTPDASDPSQSNPSSSSVPAIATTTLDPVLSTPAPPFPSTTVQIFSFISSSSLHLQSDTGPFPSSSSDEKTSSTTLAPSSTTAQSKALSTPAPSPSATVSSSSSVAPSSSISLHIDTEPSPSPSSSLSNASSDGQTTTTATAASSSTTSHSVTLSTPAPSLGVTVSTSSSTTTTTSPSLSLPSDTESVPSSPSSDGQTTTTTPAPSSTNTRSETSSPSSATSGSTTGSTTATSGPIPASSPSTSTDIPPNSLEPALSPSPSSDPDTSIPESQAPPTELPTSGTPTNDATLAPSLSPPVLIGPGTLDFVPSTTSDVIPFLSVSTTGPSSTALLTSTTGIVGPAANAAMTTNLANSPGVTSSTPFGASGHESKTITNESPEPTSNSNPGSPNKSHRSIIGIIIGTAVGGLVLLLLLAALIVCCRRRRRRRRAGYLRSVRFPFTAGAPTSEYFNSESLVKRREPTLLMDDESFDASSLRSSFRFSKHVSESDAQTTLMTMVNSDDNHGVDLQQRVEQFLQNNIARSVEYSSNPPSYHTRTRPNTDVSGEVPPFLVF